MLDLNFERNERHSMQTSQETAATVYFEDLDIQDDLLDALDELEFTQCTEIQSLSLPYILAGSDVAAQAQTGTGKTAAFLVGLFSTLLCDEENQNTTDQQSQPRALILAPTRELAIQIHADAVAINKYSSFNIALAYGGTDYEKQRKTIAAGVDVLIGTPGRLIDYFKQKIYNLNNIQVLVLDEADRMFDLGFINDIRFLLRRMPKPEHRQSLLFSATLSHRVMELAYEHMNNPENIKTESDSITAEGVNQTLYHPSSEEKIPLLLGLFNKMQPSRSMIFVNTRRAAEKIEAYLISNGIDCGMLSGNVKQKKRQRLLQEFSNGKLSTLIATDVAARGLHIENVSHVFNYDLPQNAEDYVHRIGRTARAGKQGEAISFACEEYAFSLMDIEEYIETSLTTIAVTDELLWQDVKPPVRRAVQKPRHRKPRNSRSRG